MWVQGVGVGLLTKHFKDNTIIISSLLLMSLGFIGWSLTPTLPIMLLVILPLLGSGWVLNTIITSAITKAVEPEEIGGMLGISASIENGSRVISPTIGGFLIGSIGTWAPGMAGAIVLLWAAWLAYRRILMVEAREIPQPAECCA